MWYTRLTKLTNLKETRKKRQRTETKKIINEGAEITTDTKKYQGLWNTYVNNYAATNQTS